MEYKKISVLIVTYKQADVIGRNIESILQQKDYGLHEIVICDDCSPDNNWEVIQSYVEKYPGVVRAYRNETNLGIYGNSNKLMSLRGDSDFFCWLEGDDALCDGFLQSAQNFVNKNKIDVSEAIGIFSDFQIINPQGTVKVKKNDYFLSHPHSNPFRAYLHGVVSWRSGLFTAAVLDRFEPVRLDQGLGMAETLFDSQWFKHVDKYFYMPYVGSTYFSGIGISQTLGIESAYQKEEALAQWSYYYSLGNWNIFDKCWIKSHITRANYNICPTIGSLLKFICLYPIGCFGYPFHLKAYIASIRKMAKNN